MSDKLQKLLGRLLNGTPLMFNGLNFEKGSEQRFHFDTFYMPPTTYGKMVATWIALEDIHPDSGPLNYYPKSNQIPAYRFGHGGIWAVPSEMPEFDKYIDGEIAGRGLKPEGFSPKKGDMFIWHAQLYHGGGKINDRRWPARVVNHFWTVEDYKEKALEVAPGSPCAIDMYVSLIFAGHLTWRGVPPGPAPPRRARVPGVTRSPDDEPSGCRSPRAPIDEEIALAVQSVGGRHDEVAGAPDRRTIPYPPFANRWPSPFWPM
ncbi:MAG: phytanoyl-CoA dioxygenase family protein [Singulisphaera sp.]